MASHGTVAVVVACMDCRLHKSDVDFITQLERTLGVDHVYLWTSAGPEGKVLRGDHHFDAMREDVALIVEAKGATVLGICGHYDCAGHAVSNEEHDRDVLIAVDALKAALNFAGEVVPLMAQPLEAEPGKWQVVRVAAMS